MIQDIIKDAEARMLKSIEAFKDELAKMRTNRANPALLENVMVSYYGTPTALSQVGSINVENSQTLLIKPWEKSLIPEIEKAIMNAGLGLNAVTVGNDIRVPMPPLTEDRRKDLVKVAKTEAENARVSIRNIRRDANQEAKTLLKEKSITEDDDRRLQERVQKLTDQSIAKVDEILDQKEKELMAV